MNEWVKTRMERACLTSERKLWSITRAGERYRTTEQKRHQAQHTQRLRQEKVTRSEEQEESERRKKERMK